MSAERNHEIAMTITEALQYVVECGANLSVVQCQDPLYDAPGPGVMGLETFLSRYEQSGDHS